MIINKKTIFKATIAGITLFTVYKVTKTQEEKKYANVSTPDHPISKTEEKKEEKSIKKVVEKEVNKIKNNKAVKKIQQVSKKISEWIVAHSEGIDAGVKFISLIASLFTLRTAVIRSNQASPLNPFSAPFKALEESNKEGERILQAFSQPREIELLPTIEVKSGDTLVGEWSEDGSNIHLTVC